MSYDILVLDKHKRFKTGDEFLAWYDQVTKWDEDIDYNDYRHATPSLQSWFLEMKDIARPMNGEFAPPDEEVDSGDFMEADYTIGKEHIYVAFAWSDAEHVYPIIEAMAKKHDVAFFELVGSGDVIYPDGTVLKTMSSKPQDDLETDFMKGFAQKVKKQNEETYYSEEVVKQTLDEQPSEPFILRPQPSMADFKKERKRRDRICTGIIILYSVLCLALMCILIEVGLFQSAGLIFCIACLIGLLPLAYKLNEWEKEADDDVREKFESEMDTTKTMPSKNLDDNDTYESESKETDDNTSEPKETVVDDDIVERYPKPSAQLQAIIDRVPSTRIVLYYRAMQRGINKEWKSWACEMMEAGFSQPSIVQLAGEDLTMNPFEFSALVESIFKELGVECPPLIAYSQYALGIAHKVMDGEITAERGFAILSDAAIDTDYHDALNEFYYLEENANLLRDHYEGCYGDGNMREDNIEEWMALYFKKLIEANEKMPFIKTMTKDWIDRGWIISHLPKNIPAEVLEDSIKFGGLYVDDNLIVWSEGERGAPDNMIYQATDEADLRFWTFGEVCSSIGLNMELHSRKQEELKWRYVQDHVEDGHWMYRKNKDYLYNAIYDYRLAWFEMELQLLKPIVPQKQWEKKVTEREQLMNQWFRIAHWALDREKVCCVEISDSKMFDGLDKTIEEPRPGSIIHNETEPVV